MIAPYIKDIQVQTCTAEALVQEKMVQFGACVGKDDISSITNSTHLSDQKTSHHHLQRVIANVLRLGALDQKLVSAPMGVAIAFQVQNYMISKQQHNPIIFFWIFPMEKGVCTRIIFIKQRLVGSSNTGFLQQS
jgi:hypothetical protein